MLGHLTFTGVEAEALREDERVMAWWQNQSYWVVGTVYSVHTNVILKPARVIVWYAGSLQHVHTYSEVKINFYATFYRLNSKKDLIQKNMEQRALHTILRSILNDPYFTYLIL